jgi:hypothetical protein
LCRFKSSWRSLAYNLAGPVNDEEGRWIESEPVMTTLQKVGRSCFIAGSVFLKVSRAFVASRRAQCGQSQNHLV